MVGIITNLQAIVRGGNGPGARESAACPIHNRGWVNNAVRITIKASTTHILIQIVERARVRWRNDVE